MSDILKSLSTEDLLALKAGDLTRVSDDGLMKLKVSQARAQGMDPDPMKGMGTGERMLAGIGAGVASAGRALGVNDAIRSVLPGLPASQEEAATLDKPLDATTIGKVGRAIGVGAPALVGTLVPGANTYLGATALGAVSGAGLTEGGLAERAQGAAFGAAGGAAGKAIGDGLSGAARWLMDRHAAARAAAQTANSQRDMAAMAARQNGYVVPPADANPTAMNELLQGLSGKIKTGQQASAQNQVVTDTLARKALGLQAGSTLDANALQQLRDVAARSGYGPVRSSGTVMADKSYETALDGIVSQYQGAARSFPGAAKNDVVDMVQGLRQSSFDAGDAVDMVRVLRNDADKAFRQGDKGLGKATKAAADAIEDQLDRHLTSIGQPDALQAFREARQFIAKTYSVQSSLNTETGNVSAQKLAAQLAKGKPLSGELRTIAQTGKAFEKATQSLKETPNALSPLDFAVAFSSAEPMTLAARPIARSVILSQPYQSRMLNPSYAPGWLDSYALPAIGSDATRRALIPMGIGAGVSSSK